MPTVPRINGPAVPNNAGRIAWVTALALAGRVGFRFIPRLYKMCTFYGWLNRLYELYILDFSSTYLLSILPHPCIHDSLDLRFTISSITTPIPPLFTPQILVFRMNISIRGYLELSSEKFKTIFTLSYLWNATGIDVECSQFSNVPFGTCMTL